MSAWAQVFPLAMEAGRAPHRDGVVTAPTQRGAAPWEAWHRLVAVEPGA